MKTKSFRVIGSLRRILKNILFRQEFIVIFSRIALAKSLPMNLNISILWALIDILLLFLNFDFYSGYLWYTLIIVTFLDGVLGLILAVRFPSKYPVIAYAIFTILRTAYWIIVEYEIYERNKFYSSLGLFLFFTVLKSLYLIGYLYILFLFVQVAPKVYTPNVYEALNNNNL